MSNSVELRALMGHELAHFALWDRWEGELEDGPDVKSRWLPVLTDRSGHTVPATLAARRPLWHQGPKVGPLCV